MRPRRLSAVDRRGRENDTERFRPCVGQEKFNPVDSFVYEVPLRDIRIERQVRYDWSSGKKRSANTEKPVS